MSQMRSQLGRVRGLGATREGAHHFWAQRVSGIALVPLAIWFLFAGVPMLGADIETFTAWVGRHYNPVLLILLIGAMFYHGQLGLQVIIEDYIKAEFVKTVSLLAVKFAALLLGGSAVFAVVRLTFGS